MPLQESDRMRIQFVLDYRSIYSYLANSQVGVLDATVDYQVVDIVSIMKEVNNQPSPMCPPKAKYAQTDALRWAQLYHIPLVPSEALLQALKQGDIDKALLSRAGIAAQHLGCFEQANSALFRAVWAGVDDLVTPEGRASFTALNGLPASLWDVAQSPRVDAALVANNERAIGCGVFGVPTFYIGQEMFFGNDRLVFMKERLAAAALGAAQ
ncbi:2-hydroxychromene-2-carboxylate isomerase [Pseudomonas aeruginosa]|nr:2-hydroxychromene-2-carboxylate isomerase [Pseudomonas aeruginosa]